MATSGIAEWRIQLVDVTKRDSQGRTIYRLMPWRRIKYPGLPEGLEPVDHPIGKGSATTDKVITGFEFVEALDVFNRPKCMGGTAPTTVTVFN